MAKAYQKAQAGDGPTHGRLKELVLLVQSRGLREAVGMLTPSQSDKDLRALCWNVSSFLEDNEVERLLGVKI